MKRRKQLKIIVAALLAVFIAAALLVSHLRKKATFRQYVNRKEYSRNQIPPVRRTNPPKPVAGIATPDPPMSAVCQNNSRLSFLPTNVHPFASQITVQRVLKYGNQDGELGMIRGQEHPPVGPESFVCGQNGQIFVADLVNQRILVFSDDGTYLRAIDLPGIVLNDIALDERGNIYIYDQVQCTLHQLNSQGTPESVLKLDQTDIGTRGYFHVVGNAVYFADAAVSDILVATIQDGVLRAADPLVDRFSAGVHGESGRIYSLSLDRGQALQVQVLSEAQSATPLRLNVPVSGIVSATYIGEDQARRFYVQTESMAENTIVLEVHSFAFTGETLAVTRLPENDYALWTTKLLTVGGDGAVVQFLPQIDQAKLNLFSR